MRAFIVLALVAVARADVGGYNYGVNSGSIGGGSLGGALSGGSLGGSLSGGSLGGSIGGGSLGGGSLGGVSYNGGSLGGGSLGGGSLGGSLSGGSLGGGSLGGVVQNVAPVNIEYNKEFFTYSAPEIDSDDNHNVGDLAASLKKNLRVIFIRAPENKGLENAALALAKQSSEQQTAIYVLTKQNDISNLANRLQNLNKVSGSKPEVHFVKYRTAEDAANAQRVIQQEYERLGGNTQSHNGGIAPVLDFASKVPASVAAAPVAYNAPASINAGSLSVSGLSAGSLPASGPELAAPTNSYIPPSSGGSSGISAPSATYLPVQKVK